MARVQGDERLKFTTGQLATLLGASRTSVVRWIEEGRVRARRTVGGWYMISREEVLAFLFDIGFSKDVPWRIRTAAEAAYERMNECKPKAKPAKKPKK